MNGKVVLITGGTSGIGLACARWMLDVGARVHVVGAGYEQVDQLRGDDVTIHIADVRERDALESVRHELGSVHGRLDILVANAGVNTRRAPEAVPDGDLRRIIDVNLYGTIVTLQTFVPLMMQSLDARVILMSSISAIQGQRLRAPYAASKAAISSLAKSLAVEWGASGITVNAVGPGIIRTPLIERYLDEQPGRMELVQQQTPVGRLGEPRDVAALVGFLASPVSGFITGQTIFVDGGLTAGTFGGEEKRLG